MHLAASRCYAALAGALLLSLPLPTYAQTAATLLYGNDFETPNVPIKANCATLDQRPIETLYGKPSFMYHQTFTVEAVLLASYGAIEGAHGLYSLGMLSKVQDDRLALTFDASARAFVNLGMDLSAIDVPGCGGPFGVAQARMAIRLLDSPGGVFSLGQKVLDEVEVVGGPTFDAKTPHFTRVTAALKTAGSTDGHVSVVFDLLDSGYAAFDNLAITAADVPNVEDEDVDTVTDDVDNCRSVRNPDQINRDRDRAGDPCDPAPSDPTLCGDQNGDGLDECRADAGDAGLVEKLDAGTIVLDGIDASVPTSQTGDTSVPTTRTVDPAEADGGASDDGCACSGAGPSKAGGALGWCVGLLALIARTRRRARR